MKDWFLKKLIVVCVLEEISKFVLKSKKLHTVLALPRKGIRHSSEVLCD